MEVEEVEVEEVVVEVEVVVGIYLFSLLNIS